MPYYKKKVYKKKPYYKKKYYGKKKRFSSKKKFYKAPMLKSIGMPNSMFMKLKYCETFTHLTGAAGA